MLVGKDATTDGSVLVSHSDDDAIDDRRIIYVPAMDHAPGSVRPVYYDQASLGYNPQYTPTYNKRYVGRSRGPGYEDPGLPQSIALGCIPQVPHTYAYFDGNYGIMNEHQLSIGECTDGAKVEPGPAPGKRIFYSAELSRVALERCKDARDAVKLMGELIETYGYYGTGETLLVGDPEEGWVMEMCGYDQDGAGGLWVAQRVPDHQVFVAANEFRIREVKKDDPDMMYSGNLFEVCRKKGWWNGEGELDWLKAVSWGEYSHPYYSLRRVWRAFSLFSPSAEYPAWVENGFTRAYPFATTPEKKLGVADVIAVHRDDYQGTEFDLTEGLAAGPYKTPTRYEGPYDKSEIGTSLKPPQGAWERPLSIYRCGYVYVNQSRNFLPDPIGGVCWFGNDRPAETCLVPFYAGLTALPPAYTHGDIWKFDPDTALWAFNYLANYADLMYDHISKDIHALRRDIEKKAFALQPAIEKAAQYLHDNGQEELCRKYLTDYCVDNGQEVVERWWKLAQDIIVRYNDGYRVIPGHPEEKIGYPVWWRKKAGWFDGPTTYQKPGN